MFPTLNRQYAYAIVMAAAFIAGWAVNGWRLGKVMAEREAELADQRLFASERARRIERLSSALAVASGEIYEAKRQAEEAKGRTITKEVIRYVQAPYAGRCNLPAAWVRIDTFAATGLPADGSATGLPDDAPSGVTDADALAVITERSRVCRAEIAKLSALQEYVRRQLSVKTKEQ